MRLWSTVVTQDANRPRRQSARYVSALAAIRRLGDVALQVLLERAELLARPAPPDGRHVARDRCDPVLSVEQQRPQALGLRQQGAVRDRRAVRALSLQAVALGADSHPLVAAELPGGSAADPGVVVRLRLGEDDCLHLGMEDAAELAATPAVRPGALCLEPGVCALARDGVELPTELGHPPAVVDVVRNDVDPDRAV